MTVLLRSEGIPARYVTGFAPGERVAGTVDRYEVAQRMRMHGLRFFPGQGWVLFDPTPGFSIEQMSTPPLVGDSGSAGLKYWNSLWNSMIYGAVKVLFLITAIGPVMFGGVLLLVLPILVAVVYRIPTVRQSLAFLRMARTIAVSGREGLVSISVWVWDKLQRRFGDLEKGRPCVNTSMPCRLPMPNSGRSWSSLRALGAGGIR